MLIMNLSAPRSDGILDNKVWIYYWQETNIKCTSTSSNQVKVKAKHFSDDGFVEFGQ